MTNKAFWKRIAIFLAVPILLTLGVGVLATQHGYGVLFWGGMECDQATGIQSCFGYPPTGVTLVAITLTFAWTYAVNALDSLYPLV